jgi:hypothetical protein
MIDYSKGKIYQIICDTTGLIYIGSTCESLSRRLSQHKSDNKRAGKILSSVNVLKNNNYKIILIEEYPCENREQLLKRERYWFDNTENCNIIRPFRTREDKKESQKIADAKRVNAPARVACRKNYYLNNKEKCCKNIKFNLLLKKELSYYNI